MVKRILVLTLVLAFGLSGSSFAAVALSDKALDDVSAGDWVIVQDSNGNQATADVYTNNNTLDLLENSQKDIKAVSNANAIDSAVAVQTNVARVTGDTPTANVLVNNINNADVKNYRPSASSATSVKTSATEIDTASTSLSQSSSEKCAVNAATLESSSSSSSASASEVLAYNETLNAVAAYAESGKEIGKSLSSYAAAGSAAVDYDKVISYGAGSGSGSSASGNKSSVLGISKESSSSTVSSGSTGKTVINTSETDVTTRDSKGANNHMVLDATAQQSIQAISNLNAVASGVAVQTNIASNVGVQGTISQSNTASVQSGF